ncbi:hypothetical protein NSK_008394 [Nannochloropsis salina CCMP1776]|uniref:Uncharacterized protein n=1 Tax=Nannochloropsis salina CCMP1776 TaxID=1027361 RepID=A0A4D9CMB3_9STRA|nr:hypothetical protein NSK_008394 [Nannochloropsis salina CCMP1776]|eukprot:TFJ80251.1 hypothetical protein NSK_008394 [Nannochloropsis salina CCMP1776]
MHANFFRNNASASAGSGHFEPAPQHAGGDAANAVARVNAKLDELDRVLQDVRQKDIKRVEEEEKAKLIEKVGTKAMELNKAREELAQTQLRKAQAEERLRAHELLGQIHKTIENAFVSSGR